MMTENTIEVKKEGIFISGKVLEKIVSEDFQIEVSEAELKVRPKSYTKKMFGFFKTDEKLIERLFKDYEQEAERRYLGEE